MSDFTVPDNFSSTKSFSQVSFGSDSMLLEVELNEMQKIQNYMRRLMATTLMSDGCVAMPTMTLSSGVLTVPPDTILANGDFITILENMTISVSPGDVVYIAISEAVITSLTSLLNSGNLSGGSVITNNLIDTRVGAETSRRVQKQVQLVKTNIDVSKTYIPVATIIDANSFTDNRVKLSFKSPSLAGIPTAPTALPGTNTTQVSTTAFVEMEIAQNQYDTQLVLSMGGMI